MKRRNTLSAMLLIAMLAQLTACGGTSESVDTTAGNADTTEAETTAPAEYKKPDVDYGGKTFTLASFDFEFNYAVADYTMINSGEESGDIINDSIIKMTRQVEEELNVNLELFPLGKADRSDNTKITKSIYAGDDEIQAAFPVTFGLTKLLAEPMLLLDLNEIKTLDLSHSWWNQKSVEEYNIGGKQYTAIGDICFFAKAAPITNFFNKPMLEAYKLDNPYQLVYDGKWTLDKMIEMSTAAANDINGNQKMDQEIDQFGMIGEQATLNYMMIGAGVDYSQRDKNDNVTITFFNEKTSAMVEKLIPFLRTQTTTLYADDWYSTYASPFEDLFQPAFMSGRSLFFSNQLLLALDFRAMDADFGILPLAKFDEAQKEYYSTTNAAWCDHVVVPTTNQSPDMTGHILDAMGYYSQQYVTPAFIETSIHGKSIRDEDSAKMVDIILNNQVYDIASLFDWGGMASMLARMCKNNATGLASEYAAIQTQITAAMEKTMDQLLDK